ncbi:hypothetical protein K439DRAFT_1640183, partial [Ramaria rubella]
MEVGGGRGARSSSLSHKIGIRCHPMRNTQQKGPRPRVTPRGKLSNDLHKINEGKAGHRSNLIDRDYQHWPRSLFLMWSGGSILILRLVNSLMNAAGKHLVKRVGAAFVRMRDGFNFTL